MSKAIKLKNSNYMDSTGIVHNRKLLSDVLDNLIVDTGWIDLELVNSWKNLEGDYPILQYRKINDQVFIKGVVLSGTRNIIAKLPNEIKPTKNIYGLYVANDVPQPAIIGNDGYLYFINYSSAWSAINVSYFLD